MLTCVVGTTWGDEGKAHIVDILSNEYDIVCRYQGGNGDEHIVVNDTGKFSLRLLPSGILNPDTVNVLGPGTVINLDRLLSEVERLRAGGVLITPSNLRISDKATVCLPYHTMLDRLDGDFLDDRHFVSIRGGVPHVHADKHMRMTLRMGDLLLPAEELYERVKRILEWKNPIIEKTYGQPPISLLDVISWLDRYGLPFRKYICDTTKLLGNAMINSEKILFEAQLGALRDVDYGIFPYVSATSTLASYAPIGSGLPMARIDSIIGVTKAFSSYVGEGPFVCELNDEIGNILKYASGESSTYNGKGRRFGGFDAVAVRYGRMIQGCTCLALTKLDVLSQLPEIPVCVAYETDGVETDIFNVNSLSSARPVYKMLSGFGCDISCCRTQNELPEAALDFIHFVEEIVDCPIKYVSVGPGASDYITMF